MFEGLKVVATTGSMNRLSSLRRALATWLELREVDMFIVVDWGSDEPLREALRGIRDPRLHIVRVVGEKHWCNSKCHNLELRLSSNAGLLLRLDNDTLVRRDFFARHPHDPKGFYAVNWRSVPKEVDDKRNLSGTIMIEPKYLLAVNGYNERLVHYGKEDDDLYDRLQKLGLIWNELDLDTLDHIPHNDESRYKNLKIATSLVESGRVKDSLIDLSARILINHPWSIYDRMTSWNITTMPNSNYWTCCDASRKSPVEEIEYRSHRRG
jgi:hypothetical protein